MTGQLVSSGANAPPIDWLSELFSPAKQENMFGQPSFADVFQTQSATSSTYVNTENQTATQNTSSSESFQQNLRSVDTDRYNYRDYERVDDDSTDDNTTDLSDDPVRAEGAASAQVSTASNADQSQPTQGTANQAGEEANEKVDETSVQDENRNKKLKDVKATGKDSVLFINLSESQKESKGMDETGDGSEATGLDSKDTQTGLANLKQKAATDVEEAGKQQNVNQEQNQATDKEAKPGTTFAEVLNSQSSDKKAEKAETGSKKVTQIETDVKAGTETTIKTETNLSGKTESVTRTTTTSRMAESRNLSATEQIIKNVEVMVKGNQTSMRVQLQPENLGKIELRLVHTENGVMVAMIPDEASTSKLLESQLADLKSALSNGGVNLSEVWVGQQEQAKQQGWWSQQSSNGRKSGNDFWATEESEPELVREVNHSLSGLDYLV